jgi:hypothetical protein
MPVRKELLAMARNVTVTKIGRDYSSDSMRYRVEVTGSDQRTFEARIPLSVVASKSDLEVEIKRLFSHGKLPKDGAVELIGSVGW